jgi:predicted nucleotidyltransferase
MEIEAVPSMDSPVLKEIVERIVDGYRPLQIWLFGSTARGEAGPDIARRPEEVWSPE